jgi:hypothetical protein
VRAQRHALRLALVASATLTTLALTGCYDMPGRPPGGARGPVAVAPPGQPPAPSGPPAEAAFDPRLLDPRFEQAFANYYRDLRTLGWNSTDNEIRRSMRLLAIAAESVPYAGSVDLAGAASRVRGGRSERAAFAGPAVAPTPTPAPAADAAHDPLQQLARAFVELAKGPYRDGVGVLAAAYGFEHSVGVMLAARARGGDRMAAFEALRAGEGVLFAIRGAIGRGEVGLVSNAPPPADFGQ